MEQITQFNSLAELEAHRGRWQDLLADTPHASFFQSYDWLAARWQHAPDNERLRVLMTSEDGCPTGFVPLCVKRESTNAGPIRVLAFPIDGWGSFYGPISRTPDDTLRAALANIWQQERDFDVVDLRGLPISEPNGKRRCVADTPSASRASFGGSAALEFSRVAMLDLEGTWGTYWASRNKQKNRRRNVERCERRLAELGAVHHMRYRPDRDSTSDPRWDLYDACEQLARASWQDGLVDGNTLHHKHVRPFLRDAHVAAVKAGAADVNLLYLDERPIAFVYAYHYGGYVDLVRIGFDPEFAKFAPGNVLFTRLIEGSYDRGDRVLDFGPTCLDYKKFWMTRLEPSFHVLQYSRSTRAQALRMARWLKGDAGNNEDDSNRHHKELAVANATQRSDTPVAVAEA